MIKYGLDFYNLSAINCTSINFAGRLNLMQIQQDCKKRWRIELKKLDCTASSFLPLYFYHCRKDYEYGSLKTVVTARSVPYVSHLTTVSRKRNAREQTFYLCNVRISDKRVTRVSLFLVPGNKLHFYFSF